MWRKLLVAMLAGVIILPFVSCDKEPSVEEILDGIVAAADDITSFNYDMDSELSIDVEVGEESVSITAVVTMGGVVDKENKQVQMDADVSYGASGEEGSVGGMSYEMAMALYLLDNTAYIMMDVPLTGVSWQKYGISPEEMQQIEDMLDGQGSIMDSQMMLEMADVTIEGSEKINGVSCYRLNLALNAEKVWQKIEELAQEAGEEMPADYDQEIMDKIVSGIGIKMWVAKDTYYTTKIQMAMDIELTAEDLAGIAGNQPLESLKINASYDMFMYDHNEPVTITLPLEAENAVDMTSGRSMVYYTEISPNPEALSTEFANIQTAVTAIMFAANVNGLDDNYFDINTMAEVQAVTAGGGENNLYDFLMYSDYPLRQVYDIAANGKVTAKPPVPDVTIPIPVTSK